MSRWLRVAEEINKKAEILAELLKAYKYFINSDYEDYNKLIQNITQQIIDRVYRDESSELYCTNDELIQIISDVRNIINIDSEVFTDKYGQEHYIYNDLLDSFEKIAKESNND